MDNTILIIEDDEAIREILAYSLIEEGFEVIQAERGEEGFQVVEERDVDLIILDLMLPDINGFDICKRISVIYKTPIIMLTAKNDIMDKIIGLEIGADDYITKPFDIREVIARIKVCLRRSEQVKLMVEEKGKIIKLKEGVVIFKDRYEVFKKEQLIDLKPREYELLLVLAENKGKVFSREMLLEKIWGFDFQGQSRTVDVHIQRLRKKLKCSKEGSIIKTIFGVGYKML